MLNPDGLLAANNIAAQSALNTAGATVTLAGGVAARMVTLVGRTSAGVSAGAVQVQATVDGTNWFAVGAALATAAASSTFGQTITVLARAVRSVISTAIVGGTVSTDLLVSEVD